MTEEFIQKIQKLSVQEGDIIILTIKDDVSDIIFNQLGSLVEKFTHGFVLVFREGIFSDLKKLDLQNLLHLNQLVEEAITNIALQNSAIDS